MTKLNNSVSNLPFDIIEHISAYLDTRQLIECACVSPEWNAIFRPVRYNCINLRYQPYRDFRPSFSLFLKTLEQSVRKSKRRKTISPDTPRIHNLGSCIRDLIMDDGLMSVNTMDKLATLCPNVKKVSFEWQLYAKSKIKINPTTKAFRSPHVFFEHFHPSSLTTLDLTSNLDGIPIVDIYPSFAETVTATLHHVPQLEYLSFCCLMISVTIHQVEDIHSCCPRLKGLELNCPEGTPRNADITSSPIDITAVTPALTMEKFSFPAKVWAHPQICELPWFKYIIRKYPNLKDLDIVSHCLTYLTTEERRNLNLSPAPPTLILKSHFLSLESIKIALFGGKKCSALPHLLNGIRDIAFFDFSMDISSDWVKNSTPAEVIYLTLPKLPSNLNTLRNFQYLRHLTLRSQCNFDTRNYPYPELPVDIVLGSCQALETLIAKNYIITYKQLLLPGNTEYKSPSPLKEMIMNRVIFEDNNVLTHIGERCLNLERLHLDRCDWINTSKTPFIRIYMPQNWLKTIYLREPGIETKGNRNCLDHFNRDCISTYFVPKESNKPKFMFYPLYTTTRGTFASCTALVERGHVVPGSNVEALVDYALSDEGDKGDIYIDLTLEGFGKTDYTYYVTVLCCRGFGGIYYNETRLDLDEEKNSEEFKRRVTLPLY